MPLITVIIPNYNHARYLRRRMQSIFDQTFQDFEIVLLDDASTDNSREIIEEFRSNPKVAHIIYNETNSGSPFKQWAKGLELATTEWIWIAESDDVADPKFLITFFEYARLHDNVNLGYSSPYWIDEEDNLLFKSRFEDLRVFDRAGFISENLFISNRIENASSVLLRKSAAEPFLQSLAEFYLLGDWWFWMKIVAGSGRVLQLPGGLCGFRRHSAATSHRGVLSERWMYEMSRIISELIEQRELNKDQLCTRILKEVEIFPSWEHELDAKRRKNFSSFWQKICDQYGVSLSVRSRLLESRFRKKVNNKIKKVTGIAIHFMENLKK